MALVRSIIRRMSERLKDILRKVIRRQQGKGHRQPRFRYHPERDQRFSFHASSLWRTKGDVLRGPGLDQLPHQSSRQGIVRLKADRAFAGLKTFELLLKRFHCRGIHGIERAVIRGRAKGNQWTSVQTKSSESVADALFGLRRRGPDGLSKFLERGPLIGAHAREILINGPGFCFHRRRRG